VAAARKADGSQAGERREGHIVVDSSVVQPEERKSALDLISRALNYSTVTNNILLPVFALALAVAVMLMVGAFHSRGNQEHIGLLIFVAAVAALALPLALVIFNNVGGLSITVPALP